MSKLRLNFAASEYDHFRDLIDGVVPVEGIDLNYLRLSIEVIFARFVNRSTVSVLNIRVQP